MTTQLYETFGHGEAALDIAREDGEDLLIGTESVRAYLRASSSFLFLVGSKGTGKTLLLFRKALELTRNASVMVIPTPPDKAYRPAPGFSTFVREWADFYRLTDREGRPNLDAWSQVWEASIMQSVLSSWEKQAQERGMHQLRSEIAAVLETKLVTSNPFDIFQDTLTALSLPGASDKGRSLFPRTTLLRQVFKAAARVLPPTYLFIDNPDDFFEQTPEFWQYSSYGCARAIAALRLLSEQKVTCFVSLRPEVHWLLRNSGDYPKMASETHVLHWRDEDLRDFAERRITHLSRDLLDLPDLLETDVMAAFVGSHCTTSTTAPGIASLIPSAGAPLVEPVLQYILRHTLRRPRDIIAIGNRIIELKRRRDPSPTSLALAINEAANVIGLSYVAEVAHRWPWHEKCPLKDFVWRYVVKNVITLEEAHSIRKQFASDVEEPETKVHPFCVMASLGLLGWPLQDGKQFFAEPGDLRDIRIPAMAQQLLVHPVLYGRNDFQVEPVLGTVVGPNLPFSALQAVVTKSKPKKGSVVQTTSQYYSCFISYGTPDEKFALALRARLKKQGVVCWCYAADAVYGANIWAEIGAQLRAAERVLVICSHQALIRDGVLKEVERCRDERSDAVVPISIDRHWDAEGFQVRRGSNDLKPFLMDRTNAKFSAKNPKTARFKQEFFRLLNALERPDTVSKHKRSK